MTIFWPSTHPSSRSLCRNASRWDGLSEGDVTPRKPIRGTFPACCASAASVAASRLRVSVTMHQTVLHHIVISSQRPHADRLLLKPNAGGEPRQQPQRGTSEGCWRGSPPAFGLVTVLRI